MLTDPEGRLLDQSPDVPDPYEGQFAILVHPIPGFTPPIVGPASIHLSSYTRGSTRESSQFTGAFSLGDQPGDMVSPEPPGKPGVSLSPRGPTSQGLDRYGSLGENGCLAARFPARFYL